MNREPQLYRQVHTDTLHAPMETRHPENKNGLHPWKILLVEPDAQLQDVLTNHLQAQQYQVQVVSTLAAARQVLRSSPPDVVLLDLDFPDGEGLNLIQELQQNLPVLVLSARNAVENRVKVLSQGADDCLTKPFSLEELEVRLRVLLRRLKVSGKALYTSGTSLDVDLLRLSTARGYVQVTDQEARLLEMLMKNISRVVSLERLEHHVYGTQVPSSNSLTVRLSAIRRKLKQIHSSLHLGALRGEGYVLFYQQ
ncbi:response regulator transcription factor [Deinococcus roseus]|uniref:DNA-binding response regulator n=1 Tax=Deinococcus roseus TaxID=392414 RepID=A0ABQ2D101_9DEIO|nr:response regulator transcription factor [Deinococcus roseus]GGJ35732.1 DNA-binding response regulator [Deinococcus roseus]